MYRVLWHGIRFTGYVWNVFFQKGLLTRSLKTIFCANIRDDTLKSNLFVWFSNGEQPAVSEPPPRHFLQSRSNDVVVTRIDIRTSSEKTFPEVLMSLCLESRRGSDYPIMQGPNYTQRHFHSHPGFLVFPDHWIPLGVSWGQKDPWMINEGMLEISVPMFVLSDQLLGSNSVCRRGSLVRKISDIVYKQEPSIVITIVSW